MDAVKRNLIITIITSVLFIIFGVILLIKPFEVMNMINNILIVTAVIIGLVGIIRYLLRKDKTKKVDINIIYGPISLVLALLIFLLPSVFTRAIYILINALLIIYSLSKLEYIKIFKEDKNSNFGLSVFILVIMIILNVIAIINPLNKILDNNQIVGIIIIFYSILDIIQGLLFKLNIK